MKQLNQEEKQWGMICQFENFMVIKNVGMEKNDIMSNAHKRLVVCMESKIRKRNGRKGIYKYGSAISRRNGALTLSAGTDSVCRKSFQGGKEQFNMFPSVPQTVFPGAQVIWLKPTNQPTKGSSSCNFRKHCTLHTPLMDWYWTLPYDDL